MSYSEKKKHFNLALNMFFSAVKKGHFYMEATGDSLIFGVGHKWTLEALQGFVLNCTG